MTAAVRARFDVLKNLSDDELISQSGELAFQLADNPRFSEVVSNAFALVVEACRRETGLVHHDVQIVAGTELLNGKVCEMKTGEGKTLSALLPLYVTSLEKSGSHLATANDYLAERDAEYARNIFRRLGLTVGVVTSETSQPERARAYRCDITYGTAKEIGFDFLRDEMAAAAGNQTVIPSLSNILLDEADSLLLDEARTPLIIGSIDEAKELQRQQVCRWAEENVQHFVENREYLYHEKTRKVEFLPEGVIALRNLKENTFTRQLGLRDIGKYIENAIRVHRDYHLDHQYAIVDGEVVIIDEFTGRPAEGRQWQLGLHQAIEAKEGLEQTPRTETAASITVQSLIKQYEFVCGMTGTAWTSRKEFKRVYKLKSVRIPTHKPIQRDQLPTRVFKTEREKFGALANEIVSVCLSGRSVLIGTRTLEKSELLSKELNRNGIEHNVLNANHLENEASLVSLAGRPKQVTVATNMAGRGTDIALHEEVRKAGGLHVILSELHESERIDWQLIGRGSRQGDPGSFRIFVSLEDEILVKGLGLKRAQRLLNRHRGKKQLRSESVFKHFKSAQRKIESKQLSDRLVLLHEDQERTKSFQETGENRYLMIVGQ